MARDHARIYLSIWDDADFLALTVAQQHAYFTLVSTVDLSYCGVATLAAARYADLAADQTERRFAAAVRSLEQARFVLTDPRTLELCVRTYVRHDGILKQPNVIRAMNKAYARVHSEPIRESIRCEVAKAIADLYPDGMGKGVAQAIAEGFGEGFPKGFAKPQGHSPSPFPLPHEQQLFQLTHLGARGTSAGAADAAVTP